MALIQCWFLRTGENRSREIATNKLSPLMVRPQNRTRATSVSLTNGRGSWVVGVGVGVSNITNYELIMICMPVCEFN